MALVFGTNITGFQDLERVTGNDEDNNRVDRTSNVKHDVVKDQLELRELHERENVLVEELERTRERHRRIHERFKAQKQASMRKKLALFNILTDNDPSLSKQATEVIGHQGKISPVVPTSINGISDNVVPPLTNIGGQVFQIGYPKPRVLSPTEAIDERQANQISTSDGDGSTYDPAPLPPKVLPIFQLPGVQEDVPFVNRIPEELTEEEQHEVERRHQEQLRVQETLGLSQEEVLEFEISANLRNRSRHQRRAAWNGEVGLLKTAMENIARTTSKQTRNSALAKKNNSKKRRRQLAAQPNHRRIGVLSGPSVESLNSDILQQAPAPCAVQLVPAGRSTPRVLRRRTSGMSKTVLDNPSKVLPANQRAAALRLELSSSLHVMQHHTQRVEQGIAGIQKMCPVTTLRGKQYLERYGTAKLMVILRRIVRRKVTFAYFRWVEHMELSRRIERQNKYMKLQGASKLVQAIHKANTKVLREAFHRWLIERDRQRDVEKLEALNQSAILIQRTFRWYSWRMKLGARIRNRLIRKRHDAAIKIQSVLRRKLVQRDIGSLRTHIFSARAAVTIQRTARGRIGRKRVKKMREFQIRQNYAALRVQTAWRAKNGRLAAQLKRSGKRQAAAIRLQAIQRKRLAQKKAHRLRTRQLRNDKATEIQKIVRSFLSKKVVAIKRIKAAERLELETIMALRVQRIYRGHRGRIKHRLRVQARLAELMLHEGAITQIQSVVRGIRDRKRTAKMRQDYERDLAYYARGWTEIVNPDTFAVYFYNESTQESLHEPPAEGYIRRDGKLVLANGKVMDDPIEEARRQHEANMQQCIECESSAATRKCAQCSDVFCDSCFEMVHAKGKLATHEYEVIYSPDDNWMATSSNPMGQPQAAVWQEYYDEESQNPYWYNEATQETTWENPYEVEAHDHQLQSMHSMHQTGFASEWDNTVPLEAYNSQYFSHAEETHEWEEFYDEVSQNPYWYNATTGETTWENPHQAQYEGYADATAAEWEV